MLTRTIQAAVAAAIVALAAFFARADFPAAPPAQKLLLLRNGAVIEGRISQADGFYVVDLPNGQIRVKQSDVEMVCDNLEDGYRRKRAQIQVGNVHHHLKLAQWCIRQKLFGHAAVELTDAKIADPEHPMIGLLERRLKMAMAPPPAPETENHFTAGPSNTELDRMIRGLPYRAVEAFTQSVQPVLMNHCIGAGCHGPTSAVPMRLFRVSRDKSPSRRTTQRNLYSVLQFIDRKNPESSRFIRACGNPHGTVKQAVFTEHQAEQFQRLLIWAYMLAGESAAQTPQAPPSVSTPRKLPADEAQKAAPLQPADPFDPEVFNRRFAPEEKKK